MDPDDWGWSRWHNASHFLAASRICSSDALPSSFPQQCYRPQLLSVQAVDREHQRVWWSFHCPVERDLRFPNSGICCCLWFWSLHLKLTIRLKHQFKAPSLQTVLTGLSRQRLRLCGCLSRGGPLCVPLSPGEVGWPHSYFSLHARLVRKICDGRRVISAGHICTTDTMLTGPFLLVFTLFKSKRQSDIVERGK